MEYAMNRRSFLKVLGIGGVAAGVGVKGANNFHQARINMKKRFTEQIQHATKDDITWVDYVESDKWQVYGYVPGKSKPKYTVLFDEGAMELMKYPAIRRETL